MVDSRDDLPLGLRAPFAGDSVVFTYRTDMGALAPVAHIAHHLMDVATVVSLGERWGTQIARAASYQDLLNQVTRLGPGAVEDAALGLRYRRRDLSAIEEWIHTGWRPWRPGRFPYRDPSALVQELADYQVPDRLGTPVRLRRVTYQNPLEVALTGSGFLIAGAIYALRMIRDWSSARRAAEAAADEAAARAQRALAVADILRWFGEEARAGRWHVPPGDLLGVVTQEDIAAMSRLVTGDVSLELPQGLDPGARPS